MDQKNQKVICVHPILLILDVNVKLTINAKVDVAPNPKTYAIILTAKKKNGTSSQGSSTNSQGPSMFVSNAQALRKERETPQAVLLSDAD